MNGNLNFAVVANNYVPVTVTVNKQDGTPFLMDGFTAFVQVFDPKDSASPLISYSTTAGSVTLTGNILAFAIKPADTINLQLLDYTQYVIEAIILDLSQNPVTLTSGDPRLCWGIMTVRKQWAVAVQTTGGTQVTSGDGTDYDWSDGTNTTWSG